MTIYKYNYHYFYMEISLKENEHFSFSNNNTNLYINEKGMEVVINAILQMNILQRNFLP